MNEPSVLSRLWLPNRVRVIFPRAEQLAPQLTCALLFQLGWLAAVVGGNDWALAALAVMLLVNALWLVQHPREWLLPLAVLIVGTAVDSVWVEAGLLRPSAADLAVLPWLPIPLWLMCLWLMFAMTLVPLFGWLFQRLWLAAILGGVFGPLSYWTGTRLSDTRLAEPLWLSLLAMSVAWALLMPLLIRWARLVVARRVELAVSKEALREPL